MHFKLLLDSIIDRDLDLVSRYLREALVFMTLLH